MKKEKFIHPADDISDGINEELTPKSTIKRCNRNKLGDGKKFMYIVSLIMIGFLIIATVNTITQRYSTIIESTELEYYAGDGNVIVSSVNNISSPESAAYELAVLIMEDLKASDKGRTFRITEYEDLTVEIINTTQLDKEAAAIYLLQNNEISEKKWIVELSVRYKYEGVKSPIGPSNGEWVDLLYQGSPMGFLMTQSGNTYSLRSR